MTDLNHRIKMRNGRVAAVLCLLSFLFIMAASAAWGLQLLDDGYYYLQVAWNISRGAGSSFDGIHATNGYHPLWQMILVPLHLLASKDAAAWMAVALQALLFSASGYVLHRLVRDAGGGGGAAAAACGFWVMNFWFWGKGAFSGMETGLLLFLFGLSLSGLLRTLRTGEGGFRLGILLALTCAARLDAAALALVIFIVLMSMGYRRAAIGALLPALCYTLVYFSMNLLVFGGLTPVSGYVKSEAGRRLLGRLFQHGDTSLVGHALGNLGELATLGGRLPLPVSIIVFTGILILGALIFRRSGNGLKALLAAVAGYGILLLAFYAVMYPSILGAYTYYWYPLLYGIAAVAFSSLRFLSSNWRKVLITASASFLLLFDIVYASDRLASYSFTVPPEERPDAAGVRFLNSLEGDILVGSWDAGYLGYNCVHPVVNLDGLVAGYEYQRFLEEYGLEAWIESEGITHLANVDYFSGKRQFIEERLGWRSVFEDTVAMPRPISIFSLSPGDLEYASRQLRVFFVYTRP
ncbi:MAG: DUF2079 domain-containing protein [Candidatus Fermentibacteraceae bacterium]|nr:DUF2079 domain-containing protein [Candidatus Fermentibacteraceae bacterium]